MDAKDEVIRFIGRHTYYAAAHAHSPDDSI